MSDRRPFPTTLEVAIGALLHDIGKFMQRAIGDLGQLPETVQIRESDVLPSFQGRSTHVHALYSDAFFETCVDPNPLPEELDRRWLRDCAVYHHKPLQDGAAVPNGSITWLVAEADRISAGMERKDRDAEQESSRDARQRDAYRRTRLVALPTRVVLPHRSACKERFYEVGELTAASLLSLQDEAHSAKVIERYADAWPKFVEDYRRVAERTRRSAQGYAEGLLALSERWCWAVPSSTIDDPDVSLHDHGRVAAAVAGCLHIHHEAAGDLGDEAAVRDRDRTRFHLLAGDLSGIQSSLFRLANEGVGGLARLLRGRSFRMGLIVEAAARRSCEAFGLPVFNIIQLAGGRFLILVPAIAEAEERVERLRQEFDVWMREQFVGDLALNISLTPPLSAWDMIKRLDDVLSEVWLAAERAKLRAFSTIPLGVVNLPFDVDLAICGACGVRPARENVDDQPRCPACAAETGLGRRLARAEAIAIEAVAHDGVGAILGFRFKTLAGDEQDPSPLGWRRRGTLIATGRPAADRFFEAYVPFHDESSVADRDLERARADYRETEAPKPGDLLTFAELAERSRETVNGVRVGRPMLALLKADVDNLGKVFGAGLKRAPKAHGQSPPKPSLSRSAALSRLIDAFFTGWLPEALREQAPDLYPIYAGGDDLLLLGPWLQVLTFAEVLRDAFGRFAGENPSLTLSAGIALFDARTPISLAVREAEQRLEDAKAADGKDRIGFGRQAEARVRVSSGGKVQPSSSGRERSQVLTWGQWSAALQTASELNDLIRAGVLSTALLYRLLSLDDRRRLARQNPAFADWRAKLGYMLFRNVNANAMWGNRPVRERLLVLMGVRPDLSDAEPDPASRTAITIALYRNR